VNTGRLQEGIRLFTEMLRQNPTVIAAYLGRGTALALAGDLPRAISDFSSALQFDPKCVEAWKRRGQTKAAVGMEKEAIEDLTRAAELNKDHEVFHQRGLVYYKLVTMRLYISFFLFYCRKITNEL